MAHYTIALSQRQAEVYTAPGSGLLRVHMAGQSPIIYNPQTRGFVDAVSGNSTTLQMDAEDIGKLCQELDSIDKWRTDFYAGKLQSEYRLPELKSNTQIMGLADEIDRLLAIAHPNESTFKRRCEVAKLRDTEKAQLDALWNIRNNVLAHNLLSPQITLSQENIDRLERIRDKLAQKRQAQNIMIKGAQIFSAHWSDFVAPKVRVMLEQQYSHIPILDEQRVYQGVFTGESVLKALAGESIIEMDEQTRFENFRTVIDANIRHNRTEPVLFVKPNTSIAKLAAQVADHRDRRIKTSLFLVTNNGKPSEAVQGLITVWDLPGEG